MGFVRTPSISRGADEKDKKEGPCGFLVGLQAALGLTRRLRLNWRPSMLDLPVEGGRYIYRQLFADLPAVVLGKLHRLRAVSDLHMLYTYQ
jgi:hypothetical protein